MHLKIGDPGLEPRKISLQRVERQEGIPMLKGLALSVPSDFSPTKMDVWDWMRMRVKVVRFEVSLPANRAKWADELARYHGVCAFLKKEGIDVLLLVGAALAQPSTAGDWNASPTSERFHAFLAQWSLAMMQTIKVLGQSATYWEIWNEPNNSTGTTISPANYASVYKIARAFIKTASPQNKIVSGGLFAHKTSGAEWLHGLAKYVPDAIGPEYIGSHMYLDPGGTLQRQNLIDFAEQLQHVYPGRPVLISEAGWEASVVGEQGQADNVRILYDTVLRAGPLFGPCLYFSYADFVGKTYGLTVSGGMSRRLSYTAFARAGTPAAVKG